MDYSNTRLDLRTEEPRVRRGSVDMPFLLLTLLLLTVGVVMVLSASFARAYYSASTNHSATYYFSRQLVFAAAGVGIMFVAARFPIGFYRRIALPLYAFACVMLFLVLVGGERANGARRWFKIAGVQFQPSEIAKLALILFDARMAWRYGEDMKRFRRGVLPFVAAAAVIIGLLVFEPHFSAAIIIILITASMMFAGGTRLHWFILAGGAVEALGVIVLTSGGYTSERINAWRDPFADTSDTGYQIVQSLYAIGSGGLTGLGLGNSRQKYLYLPEEHNDFIFSVVCEELGFIGAALILALFALLIGRGFWLAMHCRDRYAFLVCSGITSLLAFQVILNVAVVTNLIPCTGISLPLFSYGGTALLLQLGELGIVLSISRDIPEKRFFTERCQRRKREANA